LYQALTAARQLVAAGERDGEALLRSLVQRIEATPGAALDYAAIVDAETLKPMSRLRGQVLMALAVRFGTTRLIDNVLIDIPAPA
jgi:pantoate--beta-alanine ligase